MFARLHEVEKITSKRCDKNQVFFQRTVNLPLLGGYMKCMKLGIGIVLIIYTCNTYGQKWWDGEAGDSAWHSAKNWFPDGVPAPTDDIIIDNKILDRSFNIFIGSGDSIRINSIKVMPSNGHQLTIEITPTNTLPTAFTILSSEKSIELFQHAVLINHSGASSGNIFLLNGSMYIHNGGKYIHKTNRGNSYIISKLAIDDGSKKGIVEFDVPGNAGYTLSLSGRTFGSLILSATESAKKSYSGSGANKLTIEGDFIIGENTSFTSTLSSMIQVNGNLSIKGTCNLNPVSPDSIGRSLYLGGDSSNIDGNIKTGQYFNQFIFGSKINKLSSNVSLDYGTIVISKNSQIYLDTFYIKSRKEISILQHALIESANQTGISNDTISGCLRTPFLRLDDSLKFIFTGRNIQHSGVSLPAKIQSLTLQVGSKLILDKEVEIADTLNLIQGVIVSDSLHKIIFSGRSVQSNEKAFIDGPVRFVIQSDGLAYMPLGKNNQQAALYMDARAGESFQVEYLDSTNEFAKQTLSFPVKTISQNECWKITSTNTIKADSIRRMIFHTNSISTPGNSHYIVRLNDSMHWEMLPLLSNNPLPNTVGTQSTMKTSVYSIGTIEQIALPKEIFELTMLHINQTLWLNWQFNSNERVKNFHIETSENGIDFNTIDSLRPDLKQSSISFEYKLDNALTHVRFFRIQSILMNGMKSYSNIIPNRFASNDHNVYPNPCTNQLILKTNGKIPDQIFIIENTGKKMIVPYQKKENTLLLDVSKLNKGGFYLVEHLNEQFCMHPFIKN